MFERIKRFLKETQMEMAKVTWPTRKELVSSTIVVVVLSLFFALYLGLVDGLLTFIYRYLVRL